MSFHRSLTSLLVGLALIGAACGSTPETLASTEASSANASVEQAVEEQQSSDPVALDEVVGEPDPVADTTTTTTETVDTTTIEPDCVSPAGVDYWVDVAIDDPDGGLNMRNAAGTSGAILWTIPRATKVVVTEQCALVGSTDWWFVRPIVEADLEGGWVSSSFLSSTPIATDPGYTPGLGKRIQDTANIDLKAETLDELAAKLAVIYGFDEDVTITEVGESEGIDAIGGNATYDLTGAKDDSSSGKRVEISFWFDRSADGEEFYGFIAKRITTQELCTRGVSEDGLCI